MTVGRKFFLSVCAYTVIGFLTFSWAAYDTCAPSNPIYAFAEVDQRMCATIIGLGWPIYWGGYGSLELFKP